VPAEQAEAVAQRTAAALDFFSRRFGPYPYSSLALTQRPGKDSQGWPGLVFLSSYCFLDGREQHELHMTDFERIAYRDLMPVHEAAHQWWGDLVGWKGYRDTWLSEALANYSALLFLENRNPADFRLLLDTYREEMLRSSKDHPPLMDAGPVTLGPRLASSKFPGGYDIVLYGRGAWLFHMLRYIIRDPATRGGGEGESDPDAKFYRALRALRDQFAGRTLSTSDVLKAFEQELPRSAYYEGHKSLSWFFESWINGKAIPELDLSSVKFTTIEGKHVVRGNLLQREAPKTLVTLVPIYAMVSGQPVYVGRVFADGPETPFHFEVPESARKLVVDPYKTVLAR
jgi:hypothetical protein